MNNVITRLIGDWPRALTRGLSLVLLVWAAPVTTATIAVAEPIQQLEVDVRAGRASTEEKFLLAKNWIITQQFKPALQLLDSLSLSDPRQEAVRQILRGLCFEGLVSNAEAFKAYDQARAAVADDAAALLRLGVLEHHMGDDERAIRLINRSVANGFGNPEAYYYLYVMEPLPDNRARALLQLLANDGPDGPWAARALRQKKP